MIFSQKQKRFIITFLVVFLFTASFGISIPRITKAQPVTIVADAPGTAQWITDAINWINEKVLGKVVKGAFMRASNMFIQNLAYKAAEDLATGATGGTPRWYTQNWGDYFDDAGEAAGAEFLDNLAAGVGLDICQPPGGINLKLNLAINIDTQDTPKPRCSLNDIKEKWGALEDGLLDSEFGYLSLMKLNGESLDQLGFGGGSAEEIRNKILKSTISVKESDLGYIQFINEKAAEEKQKSITLAELARKAQDAPKALVAPITKDVEEPSVKSEEQLKKVIDTAETSKDITTDDYWINTANIFFNTLVDKTIQNLIPKLFEKKNPKDDYEEPTTRTLFSTGKKINVVEMTFASIKKISYNLNPTDVDIIAEMEMDLGNNIAGRLNNKTIDSDFSEVLRRAQGGQVLTLKDSIEEKLIDSSKWFGYIDVASQDPKQPGVIEGFSYDNIKKLVKNRIVSVGWLFAAEKIKSSKGEIEGCNAKGCTLESVINQYDKSGTYTIKEGVEDIVYKNEYCGWRSIEAEPYFIEINNSENCTGDYLSGNGINLTGIEVKWVGFTRDDIKGRCLQYRDENGDGVIDFILDVQAYDKEYCENHYQPSVSEYYEWLPGGCMVIEKDESDLCHLVDPNTVLKAPAQQCGAEGYYSALETSNSFNRQEDCAEVKHCIQEDDDGKCVGGYDYCVKEENIWRFNGDSCDKQYNSCTTLIDDEGIQGSYLINTLKDCPQEEVGCRDYTFEKEKVDDEYVWDNDAQKIYFNSSVEECSDNDVGCSEFIEIEPGINLIPNGSFEINEGPENEEPDGWFWRIDPRFSLEKDSYSGTYSVKHSDSDADYLYMEYYEQNSEAKRIFYTPDKGLYTLSYYAKGNGSTIIPKIVFYFEDGSYSNEIINSDAEFDGNTSWERVSGYFSVPNVNKKIKYLDIRFQMTGDVYLDGVQFELNELVDSDINEGEGKPSVYKEYGSKSKNYFKKAPDYLECENYDLNSYNCGEEYHPCCDFVKYCPAEDLSCLAYYPTNKDPFVPAVIAEEDKCVAECNNYQTFVALPSYFDNLESMEANGVEADPVDNNFIPETAEDCSEPSCELFTNIDKLESGAESKEYYNFVRQCVKPEEATIKLFYTWEGSDTSAFQLKTWKLLASEEIDPLNSNIGYAPCTNVAIGESDCNDSSILIEECDPVINLDCRTFYDEDAVPHNRLLSKTIPITEECINLRRELSNQVYKIAPSMSMPCDASNVGCTTYKGNNSNNVRNIFMEDFEGGSTLGWMADIENNTSNINLRYASEAIQYNGNSMKVWVADTSNAIWLSYNLTAAGETIISGKQYTLSFWAKAFGDDNSGNNNPATSYQSSQRAQASNSDDALLNFDNNLSVIDDDWLLYKYNIVDFDTDEEGDVILTFKININNSIYAFDGIYIDNIILKGFNNSFDKIKDSWETPRVCLDNDYLGCQEYQDINNNILYLYQFSDLCPEENIGCTAMIDTQNSSMPWQQTFNAYCGVGSLETECSLGKNYYKNYSDVSLTSNIVDSTVIVPEDKLVYIVKDNSYNCLANNKGCQEMSIIDNNGSNQYVYVVNNPDYYIPYDIYGGQKSILCLNEYMNCVSFEKEDGSKLHKIHPRNLTCSYREDKVERNVSAGFFTEDGENCTGLLYNEDYDNFTSNIVEEWKPYDSYDNKYAALCPAEQDSCSGFIDPLDNLDLNNYVYSRLGVTLNYNNPSQWQQALWSRSSGSISVFDSDQISYHPASNVDDYDGLNVVLTDAGVDTHNLLIYRGPDYDKDAFFFNVESDTTYRLSARVKLDEADSVMTFLSCRPSTTSFDNYFVNEDWYTNVQNKIPYAFPAIKSNYSTTSNDDEWQYIYGLYEILPGAQYCNIAFYIKGDSGDRFTIADINLEKVEGDYYYLDNDSLNRDSCNSANLKEGCVLFHDINTEGLKWNHEVSYDETRLAPGDDRMPSDVNTLLKVTRDNTCAEWLTCGAYLKSLDPQTNQIKDACVSLIACDELSEDQAGTCAHPFLNGKTAQPLTLEYYHQMRGKSGWSDLDYTGYSIPGLYPLDSLTPIEIVNDTVTSTVLGHLVVRQDSNNQPFVYKLGVGVDNYLESTYSGNNLFGEETMLGKSCRLYPEKDSPFPWIKDSEIVSESVPYDTVSEPYIDIQTKASNFENANICQTGSDPHSLLDIEGDCECHYTKADYGSEKLYFPYDYKNIPQSIDIEYGGGTTSTLKLRSKTKYLGWKGFCLDEEKSLFINNTESLGKDMQDYRCLSWYPIDLLSGEIDAYAASQEAEVSFGKVPDNAKLCLIGEDWVTTEDRLYCAYFHDSYCTVLALIPAGAKVNIDKYSEYELLLEENVLMSGNYSHTINDLEVGKSIIWDPDETWDDYNLYIDENYLTRSQKGLFSTEDFLGINTVYSGLGVCDLMNDGGQCSSDLIDDNTGNDYGILEELFMAGPNDIEYFYYDEGVNFGGILDLGVDTSGDTKEQTGSSILSPTGASMTSCATVYTSTYGNPPQTVTYSVCGAGCQECLYNIEYINDNPCADGLCGNENCAEARAQDFESGTHDYCFNYGGINGGHLVSWQCKDSSWCWGNNRDRCYAICNPHRYNYYVSGGSSELVCNETDCSEPAKGIDCLQTETLDNYDAYYDLYDVSLDDDIFSETLCLDTGTAVDCSFMQCIEEDDNTGNYCSGYDICSTTAYTIDEEGTVDEILISEELYWNAYGKSDDDDVMLFEGCLVSAAGSNCTSLGNYSQYGSGNDCSTDSNCGKTCKTYVDLEGAVYNSNNFYLNWLAPELIASPPDEQQVCVIGGNTICPSVLSGDGENYNTETKIRLSGISSSTAQGVYDTVHEPFSAAVGGEALLRDLIYANSRPGQGDKFNDYYADLDAFPVEDLNVVKDRLGDVLIRVSDDKFNEYDGEGNWPMPIWGNTYWNIADPSKKPTIKQVDHDEINGFSAGDHGISINNISNKHILSSGGDLYAYLMFYAYAETGTVPIQEIVIDWTGIPGNELVLKGPFKNHKDDCIRKCGETYRDAFPDGEACINDSDCREYGPTFKCFAQTWGDHKDACIEDNKNANQDGFFSYSYIYTCDALNDYWQEDCTDYNSDIQGGCCVYKPKVIITDNWGNSKEEYLGHSLTNCPDGRDNVCSVIIEPR